MLFSAIPSMPNLSVAHPLVLGRTTILFGFFNCRFGNFKIQGCRTKSQTFVVSVLCGPKVWQNFLNLVEDLNFREIQNVLWNQIKKVRKLLF